MRIDIVIKRAQMTAGSKEYKKAQQILKSLIATEFPVGILHGHDSESTNDLHFSGTVEDFVAAMEIKEEFLASSQAKEDKSAMIAKLTPIYQKSKER